MKDRGLGGHHFVNAYVADKLRRFDAMDRSFEALFELMFSERENTLCERSDGYRIIKTSYGEAREETLARAAALKKRLSAAERDAVVGLYMDNSLAWIECFWAILCAGFRPLLLNLRLDAETLESALKAAGAAAVVSDGRRFSVPTIAAEELAVGEEPLAGPQFGSDLLVMSSGTSGSVKLCAYGAEELYWQISDSSQIIRRCRAIRRFYRGEIKLLAFLPFYHIFGLTAVYIWFGFFARSFVLLKDYAPQTILNTIRRHGVTHIFAVPLFWDRVYEEALRTIRGRGEKTLRKFERGLALAKRLGRVPLLGRIFGRLAFREVRDNLFGESVRFMISGGSSIRAEVLAFFNGVGYRLANGYGASEIGIGSVELSANARWLCAGFVGRPLSSLAYRIDPEGELLVRGKSAARVIWEDGVPRPRGDWFNTHDLAECVGGHYRILGRRDDLVIGLDGENLNPTLIEERLRGDRSGELCLIDAGGATLLVSAPRGLGARELAERERALRERLGELGLSARIGRLVFVPGPLMAPDEIKLNRRRLREELLSGRLTPLAPDAEDEGAEDALLDSLRAAMAAALGREPEEIGARADFFLDLGGSSLDYFALVSALRGEYGVDFPTEDGSSLSTAEALRDYIRSAGAYVD
ncbi:MAG: AMP-binding protein [Oscillospiraceae bacterium]|nr:AMP-binding protein [Oscillospiraceae bacterium]